MEWKRRLLLGLGLMVTFGLMVGSSPTAASAKSQPSLTISGNFFFLWGTHPNSRTYTVTNVGRGATNKLTVTLTFLLGDSFALTSDGCSGRSLGPGKECSFDISWSAGVDTLIRMT